MRRHLQTENKHAIDHLSISSAVPFYQLLKHEDDCLVALLNPQGRLPNQHIPGDEWLFE